MEFGESLMFGRTPSWIPSLAGLTSMPSTEKSRATGLLTSAPFEMLAKSTDPARAGVAAVPARMMRPSPGCGNVSETNRA
jgi:hypothetical protein